ncbi:MAG TPA: RluA family pseudouridine synthase [Terriglobales bacterium]|nr:RluA family pseudouridine synthase [Terriglobales bacterium]
MLLNTESHQLTADPMPPTPAQLETTSEDAGKRLDQYLVSRLADVSRARVQQLIAQKKVLVDNAEAKASFRLRGGERISILGPAQLPPLRAIAEDIPLDVVYENDDFAVINKPAGMMVHAGAGATEDERNRGTLVNALLHRFNTLSGVGGQLRPGIVHRLDRGTSGLMVVAKNDEAHRKLALQFSRRMAKKTYVALVHGWLKQDRGTIATSISRDVVRRTRMTTRRSGGREAITHYQVQRRLETPFGKFSLLEVKIDTGRTHQIRVHLASLGHPVVGDTLYGAPEKLTWQAQKKAGKIPQTPASPLSLSRNFLHSASLQLQHPRTGSPLSFSRPLPRELQEFIALLEQSAG